MPDAARGAGAAEDSVPVYSGVYALRRRADFPGFCSGTARQEIIRTVQAVCREHGKKPDVYLKEETDE